MCGPDEATHLNRLESLAVHVKNTGPPLLFPPTAKDVDVPSLWRLKNQGVAAEMYSFHVTYSLEGRKHRTALILRMYGHGEETARKEFAMLKALKEQKIPVPSAYSLETNKEIMGKPFMIMEKIMGKSASNFLHDKATALVTVDKLAESLAVVHKLNPSCISYPGLFLEQHEFAQRKLAQIRLLINDKCRTSFPPIRRRRYLEAVERLQKAATSLPFRPTVLHGDFNPDHVLVTKGGRVIISWENASVGDPAYDVGWTYHILMWVGRTEIDHKIIERQTMVNGNAGLREHFVRCYEKYMEHKSANLEFYKDLAALKLALYFDGRLRPGILSLTPVSLGVTGTLFGTFFIRNKIRPFSDYCIQYLENRGLLL